MKKGSLSMLLLLMICFASQGQAYNCLMISDTLYYTTFDIRSFTNYPVIMSGVSKSSEISSFSKKDVPSFINSFYSKRFFVPDLFVGHKKMIVECMGDTIGNEYLNKHPLAASKIMDNLSKKGVRKKVILETGETVFLSTVKIYGSFWIANKNSPGMISTSLEFDIKNVKFIEDIYMPFEIKRYW